MIYKTKPYAHQSRALDISVWQKNFALLMDMGTGKTKVAIDTAVNLPVNLAVVFCPKVCQTNWMGEIQIHSDARPYLWKATLTAKKKADIIASMTYHRQKGLVFLVINYEALLTKAGAVLFDVVDEKTILILDESTRIKTPSAKRTKAIIELGKQAGYKRILTGLPIPNSPLDFYAQFNFLDKNIIGQPSWTAFRREYAKLMLDDFNGRKFYKVVGYRNIPRLMSIVARHSFRVIKEECLDLPEKVYQTIQLDLSDTQGRLYQQMKEDLLIEVKGRSFAAPVVLTKLLRLQQITGGFLKDGDDPAVVFKTNPKLEALKNLVEDTGKQIIVWCRFVKEVHMVLAAVDGVAHVGEMKAYDRQDAIDGFRAGKYRVLVATASSCGIGINLVNCDTVVYYSNSFNLEERLQSEDRCHRIGQVNKVTYIDLICEDTIDVKIKEALDSKLSFSKLLQSNDLGGVL